ncbi:hypothetical protein [Glaciimonas immobilis]|uniref:Uncharacterized protein n=1 Tax=Glaciimonas immobilis TaxID=728004 RepID=A0A840RVA1_9BURK|nr:hypothetical protein [Glaciimonas immobilis]KAF3997506.1 hypothetical protein HAV38_12565 [Glaciimonas immobilis]MBB5200816.1 hypothetical protein [Glaciimonas immobilis]
MLFEVIGTAKQLTSDQAIKKYWGGEIESIPHPKHRYGCDTLPLGWAEISHEEFAKSNFFHYTPLALAWSRTTIGDARMFFMPKDGGFAMIGDYLGGKVSVFKFGCQHDSTEENVGNCLTKYTCKKCGLVDTVDSSD